METTRVVKFMGDHSESRADELKEECSKNSKGPEAGMSSDKLKIRNEAAVLGQCPTGEKVLPSCQRKCPQVE